MKLRTVIIIIAAICSLKSVSAEDSIPSGNIINAWSIEGAINCTRILPTNSFLKTVSGNGFIVAPDIRGGFSFGRRSRFGRLYPGVRQGIGISLNNIVPHSSLGRPVNIYLYQSVRITGGHRWGLEGEWNFGLSAGWSKYDPESEIVNNAIGSKVNAMLGVGVAGVYMLSDHWGVKASINATHYSNGNTHLPNAGVNTVGLSAGVRYYIDRQTEEKAAAPQEKFRRGFSYDITAYGAMRRRIAVDGLNDYALLPGSFGVAGVNFAAMYDINRYFRAGLSADFQYDESANLSGHRVEGTYGDNLKFYRPPFADGFAAGLSLRAELTLPIFSINIGLGRNIIANGSDTRIFYQTLALKAYVWRGSFLQVGYQLCNFHLPNNLMLGVGYTFGHKR